jgi:hypothetical protein
MEVRYTQSALYTIRDFKKKLSKMIEQGNIFAHHVPCKDDIIIISSDCEGDSSVSILKKKK